MITILWVIAIYFIIFIVLVTLCGLELILSDNEAVYFPFFFLILCFPLSFSYWILRKTFSFIFNRDAWGNVTAKLDLINSWFWHN